MFSETTKKELIQKVLTKVKFHQANKPNLYQNRTYNHPINMDVGSVNNAHTDEMIFGMAKMMNDIAHGAANKVCQDFAERIIDAILSELYTHEDFEKDLGIK